MIKKYLEFIKEAKDYNEAQEHIMAGLEALAVDIPYTGMKITKDFITSKIDKAFELLMQENLEHDFHSFYDHFLPVEYPQYWIEEYHGLGEDESTYYEAYDDLNEFLTDEGIVAFNEFMRKRFIERLDWHGFIDEMVDSNEFITVYRAINFNYRPDATVEAERDSLYNQLTKHYKGTGIHWAWNLDGAKPYENEEYGSFCFVLYGEVRPQDVNWDRTIMVNGWYLGEEQEIEIKQGGHVRLFGIKEYRSKKPLAKFKNTIIVPV